MLMSCSGTPSPLSPTCNCVALDLTDVHADQVNVWSRELAAARRHYLELTGKPPPTTPAEIRAWLSAIAGESLATWPRTATGELSTERKHLKRLAITDIPTAKPVLSMLAMQKLISTFGPKLTEFINPITGQIRRLIQHRWDQGGPVQRFAAELTAAPQCPRS